MNSQGMGCFGYVAFAGLTDVGRRRANNEDAFAVFAGHGACFVADGMGGAADGEVASQAAVDELGKMFAGFPEGRPLSLAAKGAWVAEAANRASSWIFERAMALGKRGSGTTLAGACLDPGEPGRAVAVHAGDSRVYCVGAGGAIRLITRDHSFANEVSGTEESMLNPELRNVIVRALGLSSRVELEVTPFSFAPGDVIVVCSDGLTRMVEDAAIAQIVAGAEDVAETAGALVQRALENGGKDNVTVIVARAGAFPAPVPAEGLEEALPPPPPPSPSGGTAQSTTVTPSTQDTRDTVSAELPVSSLWRFVARGLGVLAGMDRVRRLCIVGGLAALAVACVVFFVAGRKAAPPQEAGPSAVRSVAPEEGDEAQGEEGAAQDEAQEEVPQVSEGARYAARREWFKDRTLLYMIAHEDATAARLAREANALLPAGSDIAGIMAVFKGKPLATEAERSEAAERFAESILLHVDMDGAGLSGIRTENPGLWRELAAVAAWQGDAEHRPDFIGVLCEVWEFCQAHDGGDAK